MTVIDKRRHPFFMVSKRATTLIRSRFKDLVVEVDGEERRFTITQALAIYQGLVEASNDARADALEASRQTVADYAGVATKTVDRYASEFVKMDLLQLVNRPGRASVWILVHPGDPSPGDKGEGLGVSPEDQGDPSPEDQGPKETSQEQLPQEEKTSSSNEEDSEISIGVAKIWGHYREVMNNPRRQPTPKQRRVIVKAMKDVGVEACIHAIDACRASKWHMGENPTRTKYNEIDRILKTKLDFFMTNAPSGVEGSKLSGGVVDSLKTAIRSYAHTGAERERAERAMATLIEKGIYARIEIDVETQHVEFVR